MMDLRIVGGTVITLDPAQRIVAADLYVNGGRIAGIGGPAKPARTILNAQGMVVIPGLLDLHDHLRDLTPGISIGEGLRIDAFLWTMWRLSEYMGPAEYRIAATLGTARLLKTGVTSVVDHLYPFHRPGLLEAAIEGYQASGIRWFVARGIMTRPYPPICETEGDAFRAITSIIDQTVPKERLLVAPVSFRQAAPSTFAKARRFADRHGLRLYTHVAETREEVEGIVRAHGARPVELLHRLGFTGEDTILVHCVFLSAREIRLLSRGGTHVVHCPTNHLKLAKGVAPVIRLITAGVNVALGVDTMDDLFSDMRQVMLVQGLMASNPGALTPQRSLEMASKGGAAALGLGTELGSIEIGKTADLVCVDLNAAHLQPVLDPVWTIVNRAHGHDVSHVVVAGRVVVENGRLTQVDEVALVKEVGDIAAAYLRRAGISTETVLSAVGGAMTPDARTQRLTPRSKSRSTTSAVLRPEAPHTPAPG
ncbi:MAG: amidohydrolase family protein [Acidimicrobiia bacterium]